MLKSRKCVTRLWDFHFIYSWRSSAAGNVTRVIPLISNVQEKEGVKEGQQLPVPRRDKTGTCNPGPCAVRSRVCPWPGWGLCECWAERAGWLGAELHEPRSAGIPTPKWCLSHNVISLYTYQNASINCDNTNTGEHSEKLDHADIVTGNVKCHNHSEKVW